MVFAEQLNWQVRHYTKDVGLAQNTITAIVEDKDGLIWVGTQNGIHRFDGYEFEVFNRRTKSNTNGLASDYIRSLLVDNLGTLWVGTANGLHKYLADSETFLPISSDEFSENVHDLILGPDGSVWVAMSNGLYQYLEDSNTLKLRAFAGQSVSAIVRKDDQLLAVTNGYQVQSYTFIGGQTESLYLGQNTQIINKIALLNEQLLLATNYGLIQVNDVGSEILFPNQITSALTVRVDRNNILWVSTDTALYRTDLALSALQKVSANVALNQLITVYIDSNQLMWLGSQNDGLYLHAFNTSWIESIVAGEIEDKGLATFGTSVTALELDQSGILWQGSNLGVAALDWQNQRREVFPLGEHHGGITSQISVIHRDKNNNIWVGYRNGPLTRFNRETRRFENQLGEFKLFITDIIDLSEEELFFTTRNNGVFVYNHQTRQLRQYSIDTVSDPNWTSNRFQTSLAVNGHQVWLGSFDKGLYLFNVLTGKVEQHYTPQNSGLVDNLVVSLFAQEDNSLYVGTTHGLTILDSSLGSFKELKPLEHLDGETIYGITQDNLGYLWMTTDSGIVQFGPTNQQTRLFSIEDGLPNNEFNSNALVRHEHYLFGGGVKGLARFDSRNVPAVDNNPNVLFTDLFVLGKKVVVSEQNSVLGQNINQTKYLKFNYQETGFSLGFNAIHYKSPLKVVYRYRLEPFEADWNLVDHRRRIANYTNLDPGSYQFIVQASTDGKTWGKSKNMVVAIAAAPWATPLAYWIYALSVVVIIMLVLSSIRKKREFERQAFEKISKKEQELSLALWGSGDEFWNYDVRNNVLHRRNPLSSKNVQEEQTGEDYEATIHPDDLESVKLALMSCIFENRDSFELPYRLLGNNNQWFWVMGRGQVSERNPKTGRPILISGANKNIDSLKRAEEALTLANDKLESKVEERTRELMATNEELTSTLSQLKAMQEKLVESEKMASLGNMVAGIAHEINTPLGVAVTSISHSEKALNSLQTRARNKSLTASKFEAECQDAAEGIELAQRNLKRASDLVQSFKQVSVDQSSEQIREFNLSELVEDTIATLTPQFRNSEIAISADVPRDINLESYPGILSQVLVNFITNSLTHGFKDKTKGAITISAYPNRPDAILLIYKDTGVGIGEEHWEKVFEPFYTTNRQAGSTGLGMHISYNLVTQKLQGEILLNSLIGAGVEFYISLPFKVKNNKPLSLSC